jgi:hypothetical protein
VSFDLTLDYSTLTPLIILMIIIPSVVLSLFHNYRP